MTRRGLTLAALALLAGCAHRAPTTAIDPPPAPTVPPAPPPAVAGAGTAWNAATIYFLLVDRFANGDPANDGALGRRKDGGLLRNFEGGDLAGITARIEEGYFDRLGVDAIWLTPFVEQVHEATDEGGGRTYGYHGYWTRDWTRVDPAFGSEAELRAMVDAAHRHGIRVLMDAVLNHTGPVTPADPQWPDDWVRTAPRCTYQTYETTVSCTLVDNLPDLRTERDAPVALPPDLVAKWQAEGRAEREIAELDAFFARTGFPRAPRYHVIKWLTDWVREFGFDGYRVDTAKHFEEGVSAELAAEASAAFEEWKAAHPGQAIDTTSFVMLGEVYGWGPGGGRAYGFGDRSVDYFAHGYDALISFAFKAEAAGPLDALYARQAGLLTTGALRGVAFLNYIDSHDDGEGLDPDRLDPLGAGTRLLLAPGGAQVYYGDELARPIRIPGAVGDANLRSLMNWDELAAGGRAATVLAHWQRLGRFRRAHPAIGAGAHHRLQASPYVFSRTLAIGGRLDRVVIAIDLPSGPRRIPVGNVFAEGTLLHDGYSGAEARVTNGAVMLPSGGEVVLLAEAPAAP